MNFYYTPAGGQQQNNQQQQQAPQLQLPGQIPYELIVEQMTAQIRNLNAQARFNESVILLNGMAEIRAALNVPSVSDGDAGLSERVPLKPMFEPHQIQTLQASYMSFSEKYLRFTNHTLKELKIGKSEEPKAE